LRDRALLAGEITTRPIPTLGGVFGHPPPGVERIAEPATPGERNGAEFARMHRHDDPKRQRIVVARSSGMTRLSVAKTYKLYIGGAFPRSESGRTYVSDGHNVARASRKDARDAVRAARAALPAWSRATAYNRGQVLYRLAEMMESRSPDLAGASTGGEEVSAAIDRVIWYAGWADKLAQVLGGANPVAGPYFDFTVPEPTGVVAIIAPAEPPLLGLVSRMLPALVGGNAVVAVSGREHPVAAIELAECIATSDFPAGCVNVLTGFADELAPWLAAHMDVNAIDLTGYVGDTVELERAAADNVKRVIRSSPDVQSPWEVAPRPRGAHRSRTRPRRSRRASGRTPSAAST
jgi:hypothetical protein